MAKVGMDYGTPRAYEALIAPRYAPIADALLRCAQIARGEDVLELGAGTGLLTRRAARAIGTRGTLCATDRSPAMLEVARELVDGRGAQFGIVDYARPLPFLDDSFDVVLSQLTYVQDAAGSVAEIARVLRPGGRLALAMWGLYYGEVRMMSAARRSLGLSPYPSASPGRAVRRLERAGFDPVDRVDLQLSPVFASLDDYITYRRAFGIPVGSTRKGHERFLGALRRHAARAAAEDGALTLDWNVALIVARRPRAGRS